VRVSRRRSASEARPARVTGLAARHPVVASLAAAAVTVLTTLVIGEVAGLHQVGRAFSHLRPEWLIPCVLAQAVSLTAYVAAYRGVVAQAAGRRLTRRVGVGLVLSGFTAFAVSGGFGFDRRVLERLGFDGRSALRAVLELGGLEFITLVWIAFAVSIPALTIDPSLPQSLSWPWLIAVPIGTAIAIAISRMKAPEDVSPDHRMPLAALSLGLQDVLGLTRHPRRAPGAWAGILIYWAADMATLYAATRTFGLRPPWESLVLAYATAYLFSRRTLPLGGAGFIQVLLTFSLYWVHEPLAPSLAAVILYRGISMWLAALPALMVRIDTEAENVFEAEVERAAQRNDA
jgi:uncharacterized membrane protein YbhN (UPF0104 family)